MRLVDRDDAPLARLARRLRRPDLDGMWPVIVEDAGAPFQLTRQSKAAFTPPKVARPLAMSSA